MSKILITGGLGYIGSKLIRLLLKTDHEITVIDKKIFNQEVLDDVIQNKEIKVINDDVRNKQIISKHLKENDMEFSIKPYKTMIKTHIKAIMAEQLFGESVKYKILNKEDIVVNKVISLHKNK